MEDYLISMFIDDEMDLDEKVTFVKSVQIDTGFADETLALLNQEKLLRGDVAKIIPPVVLQEKKQNSSLWRRIPFLFAGSLAAAMMLFFFILPNFMPDTTKEALHHIPYRFVIYQPDAKKVEIVGTFTKWRAVPMVSTDDYWQITLDLPEGEHKFAYIFDGQRQVSDPTIPIREKDDFGGENSILEVQWSV